MKLKSSASKTGEKEMYFSMIFLYSLTKYANAAIENNLIVDYFLGKQISSIVGYSCNSIEDDLRLLKKFSTYGLPSAVFTLNNKKTNVKSRLSQYSLSSNKGKTGILFDTRCYTADIISSIFLDATNYRMFDELCDWLVLGHSLNEVLDIINDKAFGFSTNFVIAIPTSTAPHQLKNYMLYDVYNLFKDRGGSLNITHYGQWNSENGLYKNRLPPKYINRANFHGLKLKALFYNSPYRPYKMHLTDYYQDHGNGSKDGRTKYGYNILRHVAEMYNFSFTCLETENWLPGDITGPMTRGFKNFAVDVSGTPLIMDLHKKLFMKFLYPGFPFRTSFIFRNPQPTKIESDQIFRPFDKLVWRLIIIFTIGGSLILSINFHYNYNDTLRMNVSNAFVTTIGAICQQANYMEMNHSSTRMAFFSILVFSLLIYNYYSACVVSARLDEPIFKINDSLVELGKLNLQMASETFTVFAYILQLEYWEYRVFAKKYWSRVAKSQQFLDPESGIRLVQKGGFAYNVHPEVAYDLISRSFDNREICELMEVHFGLPTTTVFTVNNNCTFTEIIRVGLSKISEVGIRHRQLRKWLTAKPPCNKNILTISSVNIYEFAAYLILLCSGVLVSIMVCLIENINFRWKTELQKVVVV